MLTQNAQNAQTGRNLIVDAVYHGELNHLTVEDAFYNGFSKVINCMDEHKADARIARKKLLQFGRDNAKENEDGKKIIEYPFVEPFVGRLVFEDAIRKDRHELTINKKNIELRTTMSLREFMTRVDYYDTVNKWLDIVGDKTTYGLYDIALEIIIYRVGRYSYFAIEPFCEYFDPDMECGK